LLLMSGILGKIVFPIYSYLISILIQWDVPKLISQLKLNTQNYKLVKRFFKKIEYKEKKNK
jgi:hypothetical protein